MNTNPAIELPYLAPTNQAERDEQACWDLWEESAQEYALERMDYILESPDLIDVLTRAVGFVAINPSDEAAESLGRALIRVVSAYCEANEKAINERSIKRARETRAELLREWR